MNNLGWFYYKKYYHQVTDAGKGDFGDKSDALKRSVLPEIDKGEMENIPH